MTTVGSTRKNLEKTRGEKERALEKGEGGLKGRFDVLKLKSELELAAYLSYGNLSTVTK